MIVNIKTKYHEGKVEAPDQLLNIIAYYISVGADYLETKGGFVFDKEPREISGQMADALRDNGFFDNPKSDIILTKRGEKVGGIGYRLKKDDGKQIAMDLGNQFWSLK